MDLQATALKTTQVRKRLNLVEPALGSYENPELYLARQANTYQWIKAQMQLTNLEQLPSTDVEIPKSPPQSRWYSLKIPSFLNSFQSLQQNSFFKSKKIPISDNIT
jgi:hypothetical protein